MSLYHNFSYLYIRLQCYRLYVVEDRKRLTLNDDVIIAK